MSAPAKRSLVLTIDAFGTLIKPRTPIIGQYKQEAAKLGVQFNVTNHLDQLMAKEFKKGKLHPWIPMFRLRGTRDVYTGYCRPQLGLLLIMAIANGSSKHTISYN